MGGVLGVLAQKLILDIEPTRGLKKKWELLNAKDLKKKKNYIRISPLHRITIYDSSPIGMSLPSHFSPHPPSNLPDGDTYHGN